MNVAFVVPRYGDGIVGGAETLVRGLAERLAALGTRVEVLTTCARDRRSWANVLQPGAAAEAGVTVRRFPVKGRNTHTFDFLHQRLVRRLPLSITEQLRWAEESVSRHELYAHLARCRASYDAVCFAP